MFINKLRLQNFKRFTDLTIDLSIAQPAPKLVLMIGANGSGKSCVFDAFEWVSSYSKDRNSSGDPAYYSKVAQDASEVSVEFNDGYVAKRSANNQGSAVDKTAFYGRSALRQVPRLTRTGPQTSIEIEHDRDRPRLYIELDQRFENDLDVVTGKILKEVFNGGRFDSDELKTRYINPINQALERVFGAKPPTSLVLHRLVPPLEGKPADIRFRKGEADVHYNLLSSGEKEIVNILFNLFNRNNLYRDTIYFIDELDAHLNTSLQYALLKEITEHWIPDNCQLWTASHSLGFIQYAREAAHAALLDFDQFDFDLPQTIIPQPKESLEVYEIAVPKETLLRVFQGKQLILCENKNDEYYNLLNLPDKLFIGVQDKRQVYLNVKQNPAYYGLMDRDYLTDGEIARLRQHFPNLRVLGYYAFENYLYHPDNLQEAVPDFDAETYRAEIGRQKNEQRDYILTGLEGARRGYSVLNDENIKRDENATQAIVQALRSDDLESFYPYFDMKTRFNRQLLSKLKLPPKRLVQTNWFRTAITNALQ
ncbi:MAG: AAA family ATPase [Acidobacteria bacterium]|nr:AAA family ATPase [Acidobacteriota bacterium]MBI3426374.1 AAA family ATPase [Acidobacteriota bacterium]